MKTRSTASFFFSSAKEVRVPKPQYKHQRVNEASVIQRLAHALTGNMQGAKTVEITNPDSFTVTFATGDEFAVFVKQTKSGPTGG